MEREQREHHLLRLVYMLLFWVFLRLSLLVTGLIAAIQWVVLWFQDEPVESLTEFSSALTLFQQQILQYLTFKSEDKVFPFADWPEVSESRE